MPGRKIRAFLDTSVLLQYLNGKEELRRLFSKEVLERTEFTMNTTVLQELFLAGRTDDDVDHILQYVTMIDASLLEEPVVLKFRPLVPPLHAKDVMIANDARGYDVLLTSRNSVVEAAQVLAIRSETPEAFLQELGRAA